MLGLWGSLIGNKKVQHKHSHTLELLEYLYRYHEAQRKVNFCDLTITKIYCNAVAHGLGSTQTIFNGVTFTSESTLSAFLVKNVLFHTLSNHTTICTICKGLSAVRFPFNWPSHLTAPTTLYCPPFAATLSLRLTLSFLTDCISPHITLWELWKLHRQACITSSPSYPIRYDSVDTPITLSYNSLAYH